MTDSNGISAPARELRASPMTEKINSSIDFARYKNGVIDYISGTLGGVAVVLVGHPFDTTKTRMQTAPTGYYRGMVDCVQKTLKIQGFKGFYTGLGAPLAGQMVFRACAFTTFFQANSMMTANQKDDKFSATSTMLAGAVTGFVISFIETPIDLVKTKLQVQIFNVQQDRKFKPKFHSVTTCIAFMSQKYGYYSLWQGWFSTMLRNVPANALFFPINEIVKHEIAQREGIRVSDLSVPQRLAAGACAGLSYWVCTYPLDVIKGKNQALRYSERQSWAATARSIYAEFGLRGFARGLAPCAARAIPACAVMFTTVDTVRETLQQSI